MGGYLVSNGSDRVRNEEVLNRAGGKLYTWNCLKRRKDKLIGHKLRHTETIPLLLEGMVEGKN